MATIRAFLGDIEGSAGNVTFVKTGGVNVLKQKVGPNSSNSPAQAAQRSKFGAIGTLARKMAAILSIGYKRVGLQTGYSRFVGINSPAISLDSNGAPIIDYGMLEISSGNVTPLIGLALADAPSGKTLSWTNNSDGNGALASDKVYAAIVNKLTQQVALVTGAPTRAGGSVLVPADYLIGVDADDLAVYAFAKRAFTTEASNTSRLGGGTGGGAVVTYSRSISGPSGSAASTTITSGGAEKLEFDELTSGTSGPYNMVINVAGQQVAGVDTFDRYAGKPFRFTDANGVARNGTFAAVVNF